jgi:hypothetical protein
MRRGQHRHHEDGAGEARRTGAGRGLWLGGGRDLVRATSGRAGHGQGVAELAGSADVPARVNVSVGQATIYRILDKSERRRGPIVAWWEQQVPYYEPVLAETWTVEDAAELLQDITGGVGLPAWSSLAQAFIDAMGEDRIRYVEQ